VYVAEKREVLKTLSGAMKRLVEQEVPKGEPGLIAYDSYWQNLRDNPAFRSVPEIKEVIDKSHVLEGRIQQAFTRPQYKPVALRIIQALSVHRLTTGDIYTPLGATAEELRDDLCLHMPLPEQDADFLKTTVEAVLREIVKTVSGQFLSFNGDNGQYFLDLKKDVDFESLIDQKAEGLSDSQLDQYYFDALKQIVLEDPAAPQYVTGYNIWEHEVEWRERKATRRGYLFFGAPNQRSTAQPPRDFYLYFIQPHDPPAFTDEKRSDEAFFRLTEIDDDFRRALRMFAGARELALTASAGAKQIYEQKALEHLKKLTTWLRERMTTAFEITYKDVPKKLAEWTKGTAGARASVRELVNAAASVCLATRFAEEFPEYPIFSTLVTNQNRPQAAQDAIRAIAGNVQSKQAAAVLDALELLDGDQLAAKQSRYAKHFIELLSKKGQGQVLNRAELIADVQGVEYDARFRLEPEWVVVILAALVHAGDVTLSLPGKKLDAASLDDLARTPIADLTSFKHVERPKDLPVGPLTELFDLLGIARGLVVNPATREEAVKQLQTEVSRVLEQVVRAQQHAQDGIPFWGGAILSAQEQEEAKRRLEALKTFLESLQAFNTPGKLKNFRHESTQITAQKEALSQLKALEALALLAQEVGVVAAYLATAEAIMPAEDGWRESVQQRRGELLAQLSSPQKRGSPQTQRQLTQALALLKQQYVDAYLGIHAKARLGANDDSKKKKLLQDVRLARLMKLAGIDLLQPHEKRLGHESCVPILPIPTCCRTERHRRCRRPDPCCGRRRPRPHAGRVDAHAARQPSGSNREAKHGCVGGEASESRGVVHRQEGAAPDDRERLCHCPSAGPSGVGEGDAPALRHHEGTHGRWHAVHRLRVEGALRQAPGCADAWQGSGQGPDRHRIGDECEPTRQRSKEPPTGGLWGSSAWRSARRRRLLVPTSSLRSRDSFASRTSLPSRARWRAERWSVSVRRFLMMRRAVRTSFVFSKSDSEIRSFVNAMTSHWATTPTSSPSPIRHFTRHAQIRSFGIS
jgi:hypothetical protein